MSRAGTSLETDSHRFVIFLPPPGIDLDPIMENADVNRIPTDVLLSTRGSSK